MPDRAWSFNTSGPRLIYAMTSPLAAITDSLATAVIVPNVSIPANFFTVGKVVKATIGGTISNVVTTPGTFTATVRWGGIAGDILATSAFSQTALATTDVGWMLEYYITCIAGGGAGQLQVMGWGHRRNCLVAASTDCIPDTIPLSDSTQLLSAPPAIDLSTENLLTFAGKFSVNTAGTNLKTYIYILEALN